MTGALSGFGAGLIGSTVVGALTSGANTAISEIIVNDCSGGSGIAKGAVAGGIGGAATAVGQAIGGKFTQPVIGANVKGPLGNFSTPGGMIGFAIGTMVGAAL